MHPYIQMELSSFLIGHLPASPAMKQIGQEFNLQLIARVKMARGQSKWVAIVDTDEFLFPVQQQDLKTFIKDYDHCSGLLVNWQVFGTSHIERVPDDQLMIETLLLQIYPNSKVNTFCKTIVRPEAVKTCVDPHSVVYYPWTYGVDSDKRVFPWKFPSLPPCQN